MKKILFNKELNRAERVHFFILLIVRLTLIIAIFSAIFTQRWTVLFVSIIAFLLTYLPAIFERKYHIDLPVEFEITIVLFVYATLFLGEVHGYYTKFWWWDLILHSGSALVFGFVGFVLLYVLYKEGKFKGKPYMIAIFSFSFAMSIGAVWEIFEFAMDQIFGFGMQKNGLIDTMWDLIVDAGGALIAAIIGYLYIKNGEVFWFDKIMMRFERENPGVFSNDDKKVEE